MLEQKKRLLLYRLRKEMNGAALDTMCYFGADYERNYGVQIYAIRNLAREIGTDHDLAVSFYTENIREVEGELGGASGKFANYPVILWRGYTSKPGVTNRSEEHTSELQSR